MFYCRWQGRQRRISLLPLLRAPRVNQPRRSWSTYDIFTRKCTMMSMFLTDGRYINLLTIVRN